MSSGSRGPNITFNNQIILPVAQQLALISLHQWTLRLHSARLGVCLDFALWKRLKFGLIWSSGFLQRTLTPHSIKGSLFFFHHTQIDILWYFVTGQKLIQIHSISKLWLLHLIGASLPGLDSEGSGSNPPLGSCKWSLLVLSVDCFSSPKNTHIKLIW